jgi:methylmalonic aciduria homocystinuria type C protein
VDLVALTARLTDVGFDIVHPFPAHDVAGLDPAFAPLVPDARHTVGVLVGNTRGLWPHVMAARQNGPATYVEHPFDRYTEINVSGVIHDPASCTVIYAHARDERGRFFPFQRLAVAVGFAALAPSQLLIHPTFGPWFALRAVIIGMGEPPPLSPRVALPCACAEHRCVATFDHAMAHPEDWRAWLAVRDACPIGRAYRYDDDQLAYHYTKDRRYLPVIG